MSHIDEHIYLLWYSCEDRVLCRTEFNVDSAVDSAVSMLRDAEVQREDDCSCRYVPPEHPIALEQPGVGLVDGFIEQVNKDWRKEQEAEAENAPVPAPPKVGPLYRIELTPPSDLAVRPGWPPFDIVSNLTYDEVIVERDRLEAVMGRDRIVVKLDRS